MLRWLIVVLLLSGSTATAAPSSTTTDYPINVHPALTFSGAGSFRSPNTGVSSPPVTLTVSNIANVAVNFTGPTIVGADFSVTGTTCVSSLAVSASCQVTIVYAASTQSTERATLQLTGVTGRTYNTPLVGTNAAPVGIVLTPTAANLNVGVSAGAHLSTARVTTADGGPYIGQLTTDDPSFFAISGLNIVTSRTIVDSDGGQSFATTITAN